MGFFFNKKIKSKDIKNIVWFNDTAKRNGIAKQVLSFTGYTFIVSFFKETQQNMTTLLEQHRIAFKEISPGSFVSDAEVDETKVFNLLVEQFNPSGIGTMLHRVKNNPVNIIITEHYPVYTVEEQMVERIAEMMGKTANLCFHIALDDMLLKVFGGENIQVMMQRLGVDEAESFSNGLINSSIGNAQKKVEKKVGVERKADSQEEWFRLNNIKKT